MSKIIEHLYLSDMYYATSKQYLIANQITHIVTCSSCIVPPYLMDYTYLTLPIEDISETNIIECIEIAKPFIDDGRKKGNVLVHCMAGMSRSVSVVIGYLILTGMKYSDAYSHVKLAHSVACPNMGFREQLEQYSNKIYKC